MDQNPRREVDAMRCQAAELCRITGRTSKDCDRCRGRDLLQPGRSPSEQQTGLRATLGDLPERGQLPPEMSITRTLTITETIRLSIEPKETEQNPKKAVGY
jgi:hypothetical protein